MCEKHPLNFGELLRTKIPQTKISSLPVRKRNLNTASTVPYDPADEQRILAARVKGRAQRSLRAAQMHFSLGKEVVLSALAAEKRPPPSTLMDSSRLETRASIQASRLDLGLAFRAPPYRKRRPSNPHEDFNVVTSVLDLQPQGNLSELSRVVEGREWKRSTSTAETYPTMERTQARRPKLNNE